jgi:hypothetical protein
MASDRESARAQAELYAHADDAKWINDRLDGGKPFKSKHPELYPTVLKTLPGIGGRELQGGETQVSSVFDAYVS